MNLMMLISLALSHLSASCPAVDEKKEEWQHKNARSERDHNFWVCAGLIDYNVGYINNQRIL